MPSVNTKERILSAAEQLFAESGFSGTSLRQLTKMADVNLAAVNYHFGSKENLIQEVFRRHLDRLHQARGEALDALEQSSNEPPPLRDVLRAFIRPTLALSAPVATGRSPFVKVLARAYVEYRQSLRQFISDNYGPLNKRFFNAIATHVSHLPSQEIFWRIDFMVGALTYAMADFGMTKKPANASEKEHMSQVAEALVRFAESGLRAPSEADSISNQSIYGR